MVNGPVRKKMRKSPMHDDPEAYYPAKEIVPHLWIGSEYDASDPAFLKKHDIRLVVNCSKDLPFASKTIRGYRVPVDDDEADADVMARYIPVAVLLMNDVLRYDQNVLVHCFAGMNRSATVAAGYLMFSKGMTASEAQRYIKARKPECFSPMNFGDSLKQWEVKLRRTGRVGRTVPQTARNAPKPAPPRAPRFGRIA